MQNARSPCCRAAVLQAMCWWRLRGGMARAMRPTRRCSRRGESFCCGHKWNTPADVGCLLSSADRRGQGRLCLDACPHRGFALGRASQPSSHVLKPRPCPGMKSGGRHQQHIRSSPNEGCFPTHAPCRTRPIKPSHVALFLCCLACAAATRRAPTSAMLRCCWRWGGSWACQRRSCKQRWGESRAAWRGLGACMLELVACAHHWRCMAHGPDEGRTAYWSRAACQVARTGRQCGCLSAPGWSGAARHARAMAAHALGAANASPLHIVRGHKCDLPAARSPSQPAGRAAELDAELLKEVEMDDAVAKSQ